MGEAGEESLRDDRRLAQQFRDQNHRSHLGVLLRPHNSVNHVPKLDESDRPATGKFKFGPRECDIRWSSYILPDIPRLDRLYPHFAVVQVNNVFNMPKKLGDTRWVAYPDPQVIFQYYDGRTGELAYAESITNR